ncbi:hypothetical protein NSQ38_17820 [Paenibacillus sp. FSL R7-0313]|uniref:hypothetical protein n=1 Tax=Paenibacillus sp. FSL R7-0313 TaxID=2954532 RepID=UPI0030D846E0
MELIRGVKEVFSVNVSARALISLSSLAHEAKESPSERTQSIIVFIDGELNDIYTPINLETSVGDKQVTLNWNQVQNVEKYIIVNLKRAILMLTMTTGLEKEFDLIMQEVNSFIDWYEAKHAGSGKASYAIDKHENKKGPFKSRKY